jgi:glycerophosphoryl diester phosphodiesterase
VETVEAERMQSSVVIMSLKYAGVRKTAAIRPDWTYGLLTSVNVGDPTRLDVDFLAVNSSAATVDLVRRVHVRGMKLYVWTVNDPLRMSVMLSRGVDGVITDDPALGRAVVEFREDLTPVGRLLVWLAGEAGLFRSWEPPPRSEAESDAGKPGSTSAALPARR